jgi:hypothetical protein
MLMSFTDPLSVTIAPASAVSLPRINVEDNASDYSSSDGLIVVRASHQYGKRTRRLLRIDASKITSDPFKPAENVKVSMGVQLVFDLPPAGYTATEALAVYTGFKTLYTASTDALITKLLGGEN